MAPGHLAQRPRKDRTSGISMPGFGSFSSTCSRSGTRMAPATQKWSCSCGSPGLTSCIGSWERRHLGRCSVPSLSEAATSIGRRCRPDLFVDADGVRSRLYAELAGQRFRTCPVGGCCHRTGTGLCVAAHLEHCGVLVPRLYAHYRVEYCECRAAFAAVGQQFAKLDAEQHESGAESVPLGGGPVRIGGLAQEITAIELQRCSQQPAE